MSTELEGARLFRAATIVVTDYDKEDLTELATAATNPWSLVPAMLEWLDRKNRGPTLESWRTYWVAISGGIECEGPDLPTALARLVLRVHELEQPAKGEGEKQ